MTAKGHFIFSLASTILAKKIELFSTLAQSEWWHVIIGSCLTCVLPDIDHPKSVLGQRLTWLSLPISKIFGHRGFTHSFLIMIIIIFLFPFPIFIKTFISPGIYHGMIIGYFSHIIADMLTPAGVPIFWPCYWRFRFPILNYKKGNYLERIFCIIFLIFSIQYPWDWNSLIINILKLFNLLKTIKNLFLKN